MTPWEKWQQSPELKREIREELRNWGIWARTGWPNIGYPRQEPYYAPPKDRRDTAGRLPVDEAGAERTEAILCRMMAHHSDLVNVLTLTYRDRKSAPEVARIIRFTKRTVYRRREDGEFYYWMEGQ